MVLSLGHSNVQAQVNQHWTPVGAPVRTASILRPESVETLYLNCLTYHLLYFRTEMAFIAPAAFWVLVGGMGEILNSIY